MARIDFGNNRGENLADPKYDKDAVNKRTLRRNVKTIESSFLALTGGTVNGNVTITGNTIVSGNTTIEGDLIVSGTTEVSSLKTRGSRVKNTREVTIVNGDYSTSPSKGVEADDEIIFIRDNLTSGGMVGQYNFSLNSLLSKGNFDDNNGRVVELVKVKDGSGGQIVIGAVPPFGGDYTLNGVTNGKLSVCNDIHTSVTIVKSGSTALICYGTGL
jgi:hypothetical protein